MRDMLVNIYLINCNMNYYIRFVRKFPASFLKLWLMKSYQADTLAKISTSMTKDENTDSGNWIGARKFQNGKIIFILLLLNE